ncbi:MAG: hypothetical protein NZM06_07355 [Chloroherpetonaceae bacterium]|nr:hypothetical protein [Chloroherpetonaceae bacterium]MDW8437905.1 hypothetical protein [Chloroherpetonaceae bacterium]
MSLFDSVRKFENLHVVLWLLKDVCWISDFKIVGMIMVAPTLALALYLTWRFRGVRTEFLTNAAVCAWISANSVWMTGEFFFEDSLRPFAIVFFVIGFCFIGLEYGLQLWSKRAPAPMLDQSLAEEMAE